MRRRPLPRRRCVPPPSRCCRFITARCLSSLAVSFGDAIVLVLREPGSGKEERRGDDVLQADSGVAPGFDIRPVGTLAHQRVATHDDAVYSFRLRRETGAQFEAGVDYQEQHDRSHDLFAIEGPWDVRSPILVPMRTSVPSPRGQVSLATSG